MIIPLSRSLIRVCRESMGGEKENYERQKDFIFKEL
jgi:hypothetical protein